MHHNCHPLWKILFAFLKIFFALRSTTGYKVCMHSEHQPKTFYKDPNVRMVIWEWDWERVGLLVGCEKRELLCRKGRVSDRWGKWSVCVTAVNHQNAVHHLCVCLCAPKLLVCTNKICATLSKCATLKYELTISLFFTVRSTSTAATTTASVTKCEP